MGYWSIGLRCNWIIGHWSNWTIDHWSKWIYWSLVIYVNFGHTWSHGNGGHIWLCWSPHSSFILVISHLNQSTHSWSQVVKLVIYILTGRIWSHFDGFIGKYKISEKNKKKNKVKTVAPRASVLVSQS